MTEAEGSPASDPSLLENSAHFAKNNSFFGLSILESQVGHLRWHLQLAAQDSEGEEGP